ncbi:MAG: hypothetical protein QOH17_500, partial [Pseudonocardiales bacterium]|nr:hypothetical protein [Pseudonocardiales bacterium]
GFYLEVFGSVSHTRGVVVSFVWLMGISGV